MTEEKLQELFAELSLEEKIGQMLQLTGNFFDGEGLATGPIRDMELTQEQVDRAGSVLTTVGAAKIRRIQKEHMEKQPHHIPMIFMADIINGLRTVFPIPLAQGCSFSPELVKDMAAVAAKESARAGLHVTFSPMVDLSRDARWGRVLESTGEDVYLNSQMAAAMVEGYQGTSIGQKDKISACIKHFAGYGAPMGGRDYNQVELSERSLWEEYLPAYKAGLDAGARMFMTSFNTLGRIPCTANQELMQGILRDKWGFDGILISDWAAIQELVPHGVAEDKADAAYLALRAGVDIDMMTNVYSNHIQKLIEEGRVPMEWVDACVMRILRFKNELGLFENPFKDADEVFDESPEIAPEHRKLAREAAAETFVLLKNEDELLPLPKKPNEKVGSIALIGPYLTEERVCGAWSLFYRLEESVTIDAALKEMQLKIPYTTAKGTTTMAAGEISNGFMGRRVNELSKQEQEEMTKDAIACAENADVVVMLLGEYYDHSGEAGSKLNITIPEHQMELFRRVAEVNSNIATVVFSGRPLELREVSEKSKALLEVWFPGTEAGHAILDVLFGDRNPGGRLAMSFPYHVGQVPVYYSEFPTGRPFVPGVENRFCSRYLDGPNRPLYVFGYGLDYTKYSYENLTLSRTRVTTEEPVVVSVDVTNIGSREGTEVVQMYIRDMAGSVERPVRELKGFRKLTLQPGEKQTVSFTITLDMLKFYDIHMDYVAEPGRFTVYVGRDCEAALCGTFTV